MENTYVALHPASREMRIFATLDAACEFITACPNWMVVAFYNGEADDAGIRVAVTNAYGDLRRYAEN